MTTPTDLDPPGPEDSYVFDAPGNVGKLEKEHKEKEPLWASKHVESLHYPHYTAIRLHYQESYTYPQIAKELQCSINTAKSYVHRGMRYLHTLAEKGDSYEEKSESNINRMEIQENDLKNIPLRFRMAVFLNYIESLSYA